MDLHSCGCGRIVSGAEFRWQEGSLPFRLRLQGRDDKWGVLVDPMTGCLGNAGTWDRVPVSPKSMRRTVKWKAVLVLVLLVFVLANSSVASGARPREDRLVFPNVGDDAAEDMYSPLIFSFVAGAVLVGSVRVVAMRRSVRRAVCQSIGLADDRSQNRSARQVG